jgi:hypothetical protein
VANGFRPAGTFSFAHSPKYTFFVFAAGPRAGRVVAWERTAKKTIPIAASMEEFLAGLRPRGAPEVVDRFPVPELVHASSTKRPKRAKTPPIAAPRRPKLYEGVDFSRVRGGRSMHDVRAVDCTFTGPDPSFPTYERIELVRPVMKTRLVMNVVARDVKVDGCISGSKVLSLTNVLCERVKLVGDFKRLLFRRDAEHVSPAHRAKATSFYTSVDWALDLREARFRDLTLRGVPAHLVLRDPERHAVILTERLASDPSWKRKVRPGLAAVLSFALDQSEDCHFLCASDFLPRGVEERKEIAGLRRAGWVD